MYKMDTWIEDTIAERTGAMLNMGMTMSGSAMVTSAGSIVRLTASDDDMEITTKIHDADEVGDALGAWDALNSVSNKLDRIARMLSDGDKELTADEVRADVTDEGLVLSEISDPTNRLVFTDEGSKAEMYPVLIMEDVEKFVVDNIAKKSSTAIVQPETAFCFASLGVDLNKYQLVLTGRTRNGDQRIYVYITDDDVINEFIALSRNPYKGNE